MFQTGYGIPKRQLENRLLDFSGNNIELSGCPIIVRQ